MTETAGTVADPQRQADAALRAAAARNAAALAARFPAVAAALEQPGAGAQPGAEEPARLVLHGGVANVAIGGDLLYGPDPQAEARAQVARFAAAPNRVRFARFDASLYRSLFRGPLASAFADEIGAYDGDLPPDSPETDEGYFFVCFGVGLGHHLAAILETFRIRELLVFEPRRDLLRASLAAFDWAEFLAAADARKVRVSLCVPADARAAFEHFVRETEGRCLAGLHGTFMFAHYHSRAFDDLATLIGDHQAAFNKGWGYLEDELALFAQAVENIRRAGRAPVVRPLADGAARSAGTTALVVSSGPSLTATLDGIRAVRERAVLVSSGSVLPVLMRAGLRPDLHVEVERDPVLVRNLDRFVREMDFSGIPFVLPFTAAPGFLDRLAPGQVWFYNRADMAPGALLADQVSSLVPCGPTVDLAAVGVALALGVERIVLAGIDMGARVAGRHHAPGTHFDFDGDEFFRDPVVAVRFAYDREAPGNLGGTVHTSSLFEWQRLAHELTIHRFPGVMWMNASDGARIRGALPAPDLAAAVPAGRAPAEMVAAARARFAARVVDPGPVAGQVAASRAQVGNRVLSRAVAAAGRSAEGLAAVLEAAAAPLRDPALTPLVRSTFRGEVQTILVLYQQLRERIADPARRAAADRRFVDAFAESLAADEDRFATVLDKAVS